MKVVINRCFGGFSVTKAVYDELGFEWDGYGYPDNEDFDIKSEHYNAYRSEPKLIAAIEKVGLDKSGDGGTELDIVDIPDGIEWHIHEYDGIEHVAESHRTW